MGIQLTNTAGRRMQKSHAFWAVGSGIPVPVVVVRTDEEKIIARDALDAFEAQRVWTGIGYSER